MKKLPPRLLRSKTTYTGVMRRPSPLLALLLAAPACLPTAPLPVTPRTGGAVRVVLLSHDGLAADRHQRMLAARGYQDPDGLAAFVPAGFVVGHAVPVSPTLTAVNHASLATGALPARTGIVSNLFHLPGGRLTDTVSGFAYPWQAEPLWQAFRRQGKRVGVLLFPGADGTTPQRTADFASVYVNDSLSAPAELVELTAAAFVTAGPAPAPGEAPPRRATLSVPLTGAGLPTSATFQLTALDTVRDGVAVWDALVVEGGGQDSSPRQVRPGEWFPLSLTGPHPDGGRRTVGGWCLLQRLDGDLGRVTVYRGAWFATEAYPRDFRELLEALAGFWPGPGDAASLARRLAGGDGLSVEAYLQQVERFSSYLNACALAAIGHRPFDLLLAYQPIVDQVQHALLLADPRQLHFSAGLAATAEEAIAATYRLADRAVGELARALDLRRDALVVVSDHGIAPLWEVVHLNEALRRAGLAEMVEVHGERRVSDRSRMAAIGGGGSALLYVNLAGRQEGGVVPPEQRDQVIAQAAQVLARLEVEGEPVVAEMFRYDQLGPLGLDSPHAGDLVVFMRTGYAATSRIGGPLHEPASYLGQHGHRNTAPGMTAVWMARGAGVPTRRVRRAPLTEVAAFVAHLAGVSPPRDAVLWRAGR